MGHKLINGYVFFYSATLNKSWIKKKKKLWGVRSMIWPGVVLTAGQIRFMSIFFLFPSSNFSNKCFDTLYFIFQNRNM